MVTHTPNDKQSFRVLSQRLDKRKSTSGTDLKHNVTKGNNPSAVGDELTWGFQDAGCCKKAIGDDEDTIFVALLRTCAKNKDLFRGIRVHNDVLKRGLLLKCLDSLVTMYAKCGALARAKGLFDEYQSRDVVTWTALISAFSLKDHGQDALSCFRSMQDEGLFPDAVTFICVLKACASIGAADKGEYIHNQIVEQGLLTKDVVLGTTLVDMYAKCGALLKARQILDELSLRDVVSWNALITGYVQHGQGEQALECFDQMQCEGISPCDVTFMCTLKACGITRALDKGKEIHNVIARQGLLVKDVSLGNTLVDMYAKCGDLAKAQQVFEELPVRDVVSWNSLISAYTEQGQGERALNCFEWMLCEGIAPTAVTFIGILKACGSIRGADIGEEIINEITKQGLLEDNILLGNAVVDMYVKCGDLTKAQQVFEKLNVRDVVSWNSLIAGYAQDGQGEQALGCFRKMHGDGLLPDAVTFICILKACGIIGEVSKGEQIHEQIIRRGMVGDDIALGTAVVDMYVECGSLEKAQRVLEDSLFWCVDAWSVLIGGYAEQDQGEGALECFLRMQSEGLAPNALTFTCVLKACGSVAAINRGQEIHLEILKWGLLVNNLLLGNAVINMYSKCGALVRAQQVLEELPVRDVISWNALIAGFAQQDKGEQALKCLGQMQCEGVSPDKVTFICALKACGCIGSIDKGEPCHGKIIQEGLLGSDVLLGTALVDMYAKCGALGKAKGLLEDLPDVASWNALITAYAQQGQGEEAMECLEQMQRDGFSPNAVTFSMVSKACGSTEAGDADKGVHCESRLLEDNVVLDNALVDTDVASDYLTKVQEMFKVLPV